MKRTISTLLLPLLLLTSACTDDLLSLLSSQNAAITDAHMDPVAADTSIEDPFTLEDEDDNIANTTFARTITVTFSSSGAQVTNAGKGIVTVDGNHVTIDNKIGRASCRERVLIPV